MGTPSGTAAPEEAGTAAETCSSAIYRSRILCFLMGAVVITLAVSFLYLKNQADVTRMQKEVVTMQKEIQQTREENQEAYQKIEASVDLSEVYDIATGKLGMVQAVNNQLYTYKNKKSDMVKQYADIPEAD